MRRTKVYSTWIPRCDCNFSKPFLIALYFKGQAADTKVSPAESPMCRVLLVAVEVGSGSRDGDGDGGGWRS